MTATGRVGRRLGWWVAGIAVLTATVAVAVGVLLAARYAYQPVPTTQTRVEQVGDRVAIVRVETDVNGAAAADRARHDVVRWLLVGLAVAVVPATAGAVWLGRRARRDAEQRAATAVEAAEDDRRAHEQAALHEVAHELRTPLAVAAMNLDLARSAPGLDDEAADQVDAARRAIDRMGRTVDDLASHGRLTVEPAAGIVDLAAEARALAAEQAGPAGTRGLGVALQGPRRCEVAADRGAVRTAVGNLLANAVRLAPTGSVVTVGWGATGEWAWIAVRDEGPGIDAADHVRVFERHWRGRYDADRDAGSEGQRGLGLTIARQVTEAQGGRLTLRSTAGEGSTFVVWLPRSPDADADAVVTPDGIHHLTDPYAARAVPTVAPAPAPTAAPTPGI